MNRRSILVIALVSVALYILGSAFSPQLNDEATALNTPSPDKAHVRKLGAAVYADVCSTCHDTGTTGAPTLENEKHWRLRDGLPADAFYAVALYGRGSMPARAGDPSLTDKEIKAAVDHMITAVGISVSAPQNAKATDRSR